MDITRGAGRWYTRQHIIYLWRTQALYLPPHITRVRVTANTRLAVRARQQDRPYFNRSVLDYVCVYKESQSCMQPTGPLSCFSRVEETLALGEVGV